MSDPKDKIPQPAVAVEDDIDLPLTTDWQPGGGSAGRTRRRVTGGERPTSIPASGFKVLPVEDTADDGFDAVDPADDVEAAAGLVAESDVPEPPKSPEPQTQAVREPIAGQSVLPKPAMPKSATPHAQRPVAAVTHIEHGKKPLPTPLATTPPPKHTVTDADGAPTEPGSTSADSRGADANAGKQCPKCGYKNTSYFSCDRCGLVFANWRPELERAQYADVPAAIVEQAAGLWKAVTGAADTAALEQAVAAFHDFCQKSRAQSYAAVRYRAWSAANPTDTVVRGYQQKMISQAALMLPQTKPVDKKKGIGPTGLVIGLIVALILTGILTMLFLDYLGPAQ